MGTRIGGNLKEALANVGVSLSSRAGRNYPSEWIARGKMGDRPDKVLVPQSGKYGSWGIFFSDNYPGLVVPNQGYLYVISANSFDWLVAGSGEWNRQYEQVAQEGHLNTRLIGDGMEAETILYKSHCVYQPDFGYATVNTPLPLEAIHYLINIQGSDFSLVE